ncbi:DUF3006 domain-containing protein [Methanoregula sp.]|uniref:DUF3006 domain-containing protein n=1 Tax=Methanoregula sp. TaxID=2052170 RepID=UPI000CCA040B|nr:DUF3006 domain-containing protein [Methanoregula sp.]PKG32675.1 MAG: DUF3006 domain-containing protein [Methanoregula sp.]
MKANVDRIEEGIAILIDREDDARRISIPVPLLPPGSREGDVITLTLERDEDATAAAKARVSGLVEKLRKRS